MFAAFTSFIALIVMRRSELDSARPEIILADWDRKVGTKGTTKGDVIAFQTVRNAGPGAAYHLHIYAHGPQKEQPTVLTSPVTLPILAPSDEQQIDGELWIWWQNVSSPSQGPKCLPITVEILCWDAKSRRHQTKYNLMVMEPGLASGIGDEFAPNVGFLNRTTVTRPVWFLKLLKKSQKLSGLDRLRRWKKARLSNK